MQLKDLIKGGINATFSNTVKSIGNLNSTGLTGAIAAIYEQATHDCTSCPILVICADSFDAQSLRTNLKADRKSTRLNSSHSAKSRMPSSA